VCYVDEAPRWIDAGYTVVPIIPGTKCPGTLGAEGWRKLVAWTAAPVIDPRNDGASRARTWGAGIGLILGPRSKNVIRVDIDTDDEVLKQVLLAKLPPTPIRNRGARGEGLFYTCPGSASGQFRINGTLVCEVLAEGRQTLLPPTIHPGTGKPYFWSGVMTLLEVEAPLYVGR
jgi:hypothetical protein